ncbi:MAG: hypothetical protein AB7P49_05490, partial [Bdellovibrionales bacterium]
SDLIVEPQVRRECFCTKCRLPFNAIKEWVKKQLKAPPLGSYTDVEIIFISCAESASAAIAVRWLRQSLSTPSSLR